MLPKFPKINQDFLNQLRGLFYSKDRPIVINSFLVLPSIDTPSENPPSPYRYLYTKSDNGLYLLDSEGNEVKIG